MARPDDLPVVENLTVLALCLVMLSMPAVAIVHRDKIIERLSKGDRLIDIARDLGVTTHAAISKHLANDPDYQEARAASVEARMDIRETDLENAEDSVTVARARELLSHARWRAEREFPGKWGQKNQSISVVVQVSADELVGSAEDLLKSVAASREKVVNDLTNLQVLESKE